MKLKHRALTLLLSLAMLLSLMPATAFATTGDDWVVTNYGQQYLLSGSSVKLTVETDYTGSKQISYQWYLDDTKISGATGKSYYATQVGTYFCDVTIGGDNAPALYFVKDHWFVTNDLEEFSMEDKNTGVTITVQTNYGGSSSDLTYQWYYQDVDADEVVEETLNGATSRSYTAHKYGYYRCVVSTGSQTEEGAYWVVPLEEPLEVTNDGESYTILNGNPVVLKVETNYTGDPSDLTYKWYECDWDEETGDWVRLPVGTPKVLGRKTSYTARTEGLYECYVTDGDEEASGFYSVENGDCVLTKDSIIYVHDEDYAEDQAGVEGFEEDDNGNAPSGSLTIPDTVEFLNGKKYKVTEIQNLYGLPDVTSITIPASVTYIAEEAIGYYGYADQAETTPLNNKVANLTIIGKTGSEAQRYANANGFAFRDPEAEAAAAEAARRQAEEAARQQAAIAAAEAARQGTPGALPKLKASKPVAAKKAITVKWKKLSKKQLKQGATNIEVWVCTDGAFASGSTIERVVGKKKSSVKIKGLQKGVTYYAKARAIQYVGGTKVVGPWSATKKVKVKK